jgi:hypothetical protein
VKVGSRLPTCTRHVHQHRMTGPEVVLIPFVSPDDEHDVLETCRELQIHRKEFVRHVGHLPRIINQMYLYEFMYTFTYKYRKS